MGRFTRKLETKGMKMLLSDKGVKEKAYAKSLVKLNEAKKELLSEFENHPVTREIAAGPDASNISRTVVGQGNLFTFIGFDEGYDPIAPVYQLLDQGTRLMKTGAKTTRRGKRNVLVYHMVSMPNKKRLMAVSPMPWEPGSWLFRIERGISGLGYYIYKNYIRASRSGRAIQSKYKVDNSLFKRTKYMSTILNNFQRRLKV